MAPDHALVALDGSPLADAALDHALDTFACPITVLSVVTPIDASMSEGGVLDPGPDRLEAAERALDDRVATAKARTECADRTVETVVTTGDPAAAIGEAIDAYDIDHVVMGDHGSDASELQLRLFGTDVTAVLGETSVPVTILR